ncbi:hypothetical protein, partial [Paenibacillus hubeiensis]|uniref:hypothetical protein n=1 Tax=Paenibacillus hubeiensis TaxID=3077330 RepID=UPI0031BB68AF
MLNNKKIEMSYKRYIKNFTNEHKYERTKQRYLNNLKEVSELVELNEVEKDHILLINLGSVFSYQLLNWKNDILLSEGNRSEALKQMYKVVFYQCMSQELYKTRYPQMMKEYTFNKVVTALIHFTMFGWEKEEMILYSFIVEHLGGELLDVNESNKHTWFLLELYLKFRGKVLLGNNHAISKKVKEMCINNGIENRLIPEDLGIYEEVLTDWATNDTNIIYSLINEMSLYHSLQVSELGQFIEFGDYVYGFYPYEILFLLHVRKKQGLPNPTHFDD